MSGCIVAAYTAIVFYCRQKSNILMAREDRHRELVSVKREVIAGRSNRSYGRWTERPAKTTAPKSLDRKGLILAPVSRVPYEQQHVELLERGLALIEKLQDP
jgi:hypothetical protein